MAEIHVYGKLRCYAQNKRPTKESVIRIEPNPDETIESLLTRVGISVSEIHHIFLNSKLLATHDTMAIWLGYEQERGSPFNWDLRIPVKSGDRIGLFGKDLAMLVI